MNSSKEKDINDVGEVNRQKFKVIICNDKSGIIHVNGIIGYQYNKRVITNIS